MLKTLRLSFSLRNTYRVNSILYSLRQLPIIKNIIPSSLYGISGLKIFANVLSVLWEIISIFIWKLLYVLIMVFAAITLMEVPEINTSPVFMHILFFLSIIGAIANTYMFNPTKDKYYAMILLGMNAKEYTLVNYFYAIIKVLLGFAVSTLIFGTMLNVPVWQCLIIPFFVAGIKMFASTTSLIGYEKRGTVHNENKLKALWWILLVALLAASYVLPLAGFFIPANITVILMTIGILLGIVSFGKIVSFAHYRQMYKELLVDTVFDTNAVAVNAQAEQSRKRISTDTNIKSNRKGFEYLNELFIKRHQRVLWKPVLRISLGALVFFAISLIALRFYPDANAEVNEILLTYLPLLVFVMYFLNRGTSFTQALFINCDHSLLTYSFYKQPKYILKLFWIRLREIVKINLVPGVVIGLGLVILLFSTGGTDNPLNYVVLFVSMVALSIFFSVHYLMLYYLLQPYNAGTEVKSGTYQVIVWATYVVYYVMIKVQMPTIIFGMATIIFCLLYSLIASILVYKLAPKTFKIRN